MKVLLIEDNEILSRNTVRYFANKDIHCDVSFNGKDWLYKAKTNYYDAVILDIALPKMDWLELCKNLRESWKNVPIIMLTSRSTKEDIIIGLDSWADDYLTKPFNYEELIARIKSLARRNLKNKASIIKVWEYTIDLEKNEVKKDNFNSCPLNKGKDKVNWPERSREGALGYAWKAERVNKNIKLSNLEFRLITYFAQNQGKVISKKELYEKVWWEFDWDIMFSKTVEVYIWYLRKKLDKNLIKTVKWAGYIIK